MKNQLSILEQKSFKDLAYISWDLPNRVEDGSAKKVQSDSEGWFT